MDNHRTNVTRGTTWLAIVGSILAGELLTFCGGHTSPGDLEDGGSKGGTAGSAGFGGSGGSGGTGPTGGLGGRGGVGGHTSGCPGGCGASCAPCTTGAGGFAGNAGASGSAGMAGSGGSCAGQCGGSCPACVDAGDAGDAADAADPGDATDASAASFSARSPLITGDPREVKQACYELSGYEPDPCLPADDALLGWLVAPTPACKAHVTEGPVAYRDRRSRTCCYLVTCDEQRPEDSR